jgi:HEAT repeat protein
MSEALRGAAIDPETVVARLRDLREGQAVVLQAVRLGIGAVPPLESLLRGPSEPVFQPRCLAADALAAIGGRAALDALLAALEDSIHRDLSPVLRLSEDAVANRIAEHLGRCDDPRVREALLSALRVRPYAECARSLGRLREARAVPLLVGCLYDDFAREAARDALVELGSVSIPALSRVLLEPRDEPGLEGSIRVAARVAAAEALGRIGVTEAEHALLAARNDPEKAVRIAAWALGDPERAIRHSSNHALLRMGAATVPALREAVEQARSGPGGLLRRWRVRRLAAHALRTVVRVAALDAPRSREKG